MLQKTQFNKVNSLFAFFAALGLQHVGASESTLSGTLMRQKMAKSNTTRASNMDVQAHIATDGVPMKPAFTENDDSTQASLAFDLQVRDEAFGNTTLQGNTSQVEDANLWGRRRRRFWSSRRRRERRRRNRRRAAVTAPPFPAPSPASNEAASCTNETWCTDEVKEPSTYGCSDSCVDRNKEKKDFGECSCTDLKCPEMWQCIQYRYDTATNQRAKQACDNVWAGKYGASPGLLDLADTGVEVEMPQKCEISDEHCCHELLRPCKEWNEKCFKEIAANEGWFLGIYNDSTINKTAQENGLVATFKRPPPGALNATLPTVPSELTSTTESGDGDPSKLDESLADKRSC